MTNTTTQSPKQHLPDPAKGDPPFPWRKHLPVHPAADEYPLLRETDPAAFQALVEDIASTACKRNWSFGIAAT
jgi:hypothetical protein